METAKAEWTKDCQCSFYTALVKRCEQIKASRYPEAEFRKAARWLDRLYGAVAMPPSAFASADNRLLIALMRAENKRAA